MKRQPRLDRRIARTQLCIADILLWSATKMTVRNRSERSLWPAVVVSLNSLRGVLTAILDGDPVKEAG